MMRLDPVKGAARHRGSSTCWTNNRPRDWTRDCNATKRSLSNVRLDLRAVNDNEKTTVELTQGVFIVSVNAGLPSGQLNYFE